MILEALNIYFQKEQMLIELVNNLTQTGNHVKKKKEKKLLNFIFRQTFCFLFLPGRYRLNPKIQTTLNHIVGFVYESLVVFVYEFITICDSTQGSE